VFIATVVLSVLVAAAVLGSGAAKLAGAKQSIAIRDRLGVTPWLWRGIGILEVGAAAGLTAGLAVPVLGIAAAVGLVLLLIGAIGAHARANDLSNAIPAVGLLLLTIAAAITRLASS
jgi:DoxX-like protein